LALLHWCLAERHELSAWHDLLFPRHSFFQQTPDHFLLCLALQRHKAESRAKGPHSQGCCLSLGHTDSAHVEGPEATPSLLTLPRLEGSAMKDSVCGLPESRAGLHLTLCVTRAALSLPLLILGGQLSQFHIRAWCVMPW
jgi:hypothetical protein